MDNRTIDRPNLVCGGFFVLAGLVFAAQALSVDLGSWNRIGPGGLPLVLSGLLVLVGLIIVAQAMRAAGEPVGRIAWRGIVFILAAPIVFGLTVRPLGFVASVFIAALIASFASMRMGPVRALILSVALTAFSTLVFSYGLGLPFERIGPWLRW